AAGPSEVPPLVDEIHVLVEDLNSVVRAIGDEEASLGVVGQAVRSDELARLGAVSAERLDELSVASVEDQAIAILWIRFWPRPVTVGNHDVAVRRGVTPGRLQKRVVARLRHASLPEREQQLAVLIELEHLVALDAGHAGRISEWAAVDRPEISVAVLAETM